MTTTVKTCFKCCITKSLHEFYVHPQMGDGRLNKCKACSRRDVSNNYRANISHYVRYEKKRSRSPLRAAAQRSYQAARNPVKRRAAYLTSNAIRDGRLLRQPCEKCGMPKAQAHHDDYSRPLDVRWLCRAHHLEHHGKMSRS